MSRCSPDPFCSLSPFTNSTRDPKLFLNASESELPLRVDLPESPEFYRAWSTLQSVHLLQAVLTINVLPLRFSYAEHSF